MRSQFGPGINSEWDEIKVEYESEEEETYFAAANNDILHTILKVGNDIYIGVKHRPWFFQQLP
jgi:hypothetical protein